MELERIYRPVRRELEGVEKRLSEMAVSGNDVLDRAILQILGSGGKRLRPALVLMSTKTCGYSGDRSIRLAAALELIHTTSLIHDDVVDGAVRRRGAATLNACWGNRLSVLVGDHLYAKVVGMLAEDGDAAILETVASTVARMTESEIAQTLCRKNLKVTEEEYLAMIAGKTASLISCCCRVGAMLGDVHDGEVEIISDYGKNLGMAFQITDDLLDIAGDNQKMGKTIGNDIREGRLTLPFIHTIGIAEKKDAAQMMKAFRSGRVDDNVLARMQKAVQEYGGVEYGLKKAKEYGRACKAGLKSLRKCESQTSLAMLTDYVITRIC